MDLNHPQNHELKIRFAKPEDCQLIWEWANDPNTRAVSFSSEPIPWESHVKWFSAKLTDSNCMFFIALDANDFPIGQIRYEVDGTEATVSVALAPSQRGKGYGTQIIQMASQKVFDCMSIGIIHAYIKPDNTTSIRAFAKVRFSNNGLIEVHGNPALDFILRRPATTP